MSAPLKVALAGFGETGAAIAGRLSREIEDFSLSAILVNKIADNRRTIYRPLLTDQVDKLFEDGPDIYVDASCGLTFHELSGLALETGVHVVNTNARSTAIDLRGRIQSAAQHRQHYLYNACIGGNAEILETIARARRVAPVIAVDAIIDGAANYLVSCMADGMTYRGACEDALSTGMTQRQLADAVDADLIRAGLRLMAFTAFGTTLIENNIPVDPIPNLLDFEACPPGRPVRAMARLRQIDNQFSAEMRLVENPNDSLMAATDGTGCAVSVKTGDGQTWTATGTGSGACAVANAVLRDLGQIARERADTDLTS